MPWVVIAANARATASPNSSAVPRCRNGKATTTVSSSPGLATAATLVLSVPAARRTTAAASSAAASARVGECGSPTVGLRTRSARCQATTAAGSAPSTPAASSVSLTAGRGKYRFGPVSTRSSTGWPRSGASGCMRRTLRA